MKKDFFNLTRILDGGIGQELLARGMEPKGTLWSATALLEDKYHQLLLDIYLDYIKAGAEVIITSTFTTRRLRLRENNIENKFEYLNSKAGEIAKQAQALHPDVLIAGGLPPQHFTYEQDTRPDVEIKENFYDQAKLLNPYVDFFYFDVLSSVKEINLAIEAIKEFDKPYLIGAHISQGNTMPSGEKLSEIITKIEHKNLLGVMLSCVSPESYDENLDEIKSLDVPFGFKLNGFVTTKPKESYTSSYKKSKTGNPNDILGKRKDLTPKNMANIIKRYQNAGATIFGGCCETSPLHIEEMAKLK